MPFVATVRFATIRRTDVPGSYTPDGNLYGLFPFEAGGSLSHLVFRLHALTFDFVAMKLLAVNRKGYGAASGGAVDGLGTRGRTDES